MMLGREDQKLAQLEARLALLEDRVSGLAADAIEDTPPPELAQRVYRLEERLDRLVSHLVGSLGMSIDERKQL
jgi:hypothetical protein